MQKENLEKKDLLNKKNIVLSLIIPARNEEENIKDTVESLIPYIPTSNSEIIIVNDHSEDKTELIGKELSKKYPFVKIVNNLNPPGFANALKTGFENSSGEFVLPVMADKCDDPATIPEMLKLAQKGFDIVCGSRYVKGGKKIGGPKLQGFFSFFVCRSLKFLINLPTHDVSNAFKLYRKNILEKIIPLEKGFAISMEITLKAYFKNYKITEVPTIWYGRKKGKSKFKISKTFPYFKLYFWAILKKWKFL